MDYDLETDFLTARPSFLEGAGRLMDFSGALNTYNRSATPAEADALAMRQDFAMVGRDMAVAIEQAQQDR